MNQTSASPVRTVARAVLVVSVAILLLLSNLYLVATPTFIRHEYSKPGFPPADLYTPAERQVLAEATLHYLRSRAGPEYLWDLSLEGWAVYNPREVKHLVDVKVVMQAAFWLQACALLLAAVTIAILWRGAGGKLAVLRAVYWGSGGLLLCVAAIGLLAYTSFDVFFVLFHRVFFQGDSWLFAYSDTLIQLFPVQFWMDAAAALVLPAIAESVVVGGLAYVLSRRVGGGPSS